jgi:hypothetical protein
MVAAAGVAYVAYGLNWDQRIADHLATLKSQTGLSIRATSGSTLRVSGLSVQGLVVTGPRGLQGVLRDVTFSVDWQGWITGRALFDQIHVASLEVLRDGAPLYTQKDLTFSLKKTDDNRLVLSGQGMALRLFMRPQQTDFDWVFGENWLISGSWIPGGKVVFRAPTAGLQGLAGSITLSPDSLSGDLQVIKENTGQDFDGFAGLSLETLVPDSVDLTLRSQAAHGLKDVVARFHRARASDPLTLDITGQHDLGPFAATITADYQDGWHLTLSTMRLGRVEGSGSWGIKTEKEGRARHDIRLRLRYLSLSQGSSMDLFSSLRRLQDQYHLNIVAEEIKLGPLLLHTLETEAQVTGEAITLSSLRLKTSLDGRFSLSGTVSYPTNTPSLNMDVQTAGPFFTDLMASFPNFPKVFAHLNGDMQVKIQGYAHYPEIILRHRGASGAVASFKGRLEALTAPPRFNGLAAYRLSPETQVSMTVVRGEKELRLSPLQGTLGGFPFSGQANVDLTVDPPMMQGNLYAPTLSPGALLAATALFSSQEGSTSCRHAEDGLALPVRDSRDMNAQMRVRVDRLILPDYGDLTQVDQKLSLSPAGTQFSMTGRHGRGSVGAKMQIMPGQGLPILEMAVQGKDIVFPDWGGNTSVFLKTASFGACLRDHLQSVTGQGSFKGNNLRPPPAFLKKIQNLAGPALGRTLTPQDLDVRSAWFQGDFRQGILSLQQGDIALPSAQVTLGGSLNVAAQQVALRASVTSPQAAKPMVITVNGPLTRPDIQINNQSLWQYLLLGGGR